MENRIVRNKNFLKSLLKSRNKSQRKKLVKTATKDEITSICELCLNLKRLNSFAHPELGKSLKKYKPSIKSLLNKRLGTERKRSIIIQQGGFLPFLAPIAGTLIAGLVSQWLKN